MAPLPGVRGPFVVFLSGVGTMGRQIDAWEQRLIDRLAAGMREGEGGPGGVMVTGLFPFSASAQPLAERRRTGAFWGRLGRMRDEHPNLLTRLIDWRNLTQVLVSMDPRYGPIYNAGGARSLYAALVNHGYVAASGAPVVLIGYSGGAQVCLGAATYLKPALDAPLTVVSLGGAVGSDRGLESVDRMYHLYGSGDIEQKLPAILLPSRWSLARRSRWNRALADGRLRYVPLGDMIHTGPKGYLDPDSHTPDGRSFLDVTAAEMLEIVERSTRGDFRTGPAAWRSGDGQAERSGGSRAPIALAGPHGGGLDGAAGAAADEAESDVSARPFRRVAAAGGDAVARVVAVVAEVRAPFHHLALAHAGAGGVLPGAAPVPGGAPPVGAPLPHVPDGVVEAMAVRRERVRGAGAEVAVVERVVGGESPLPHVAAVDAAGRQLVAPRVAALLEAAPRRRTPTPPPWAGAPPPTRSRPPRRAR